MKTQLVLGFVLAGGAVAYAQDEAAPPPPAPPDTLEEFDRIERRLEELLRRLERFDPGEGESFTIRGIPRLGDLFEGTQPWRSLQFQPGEGFSQSLGSSVRVEQGPDGSVEVTITETEDGDTQTKEYRAESWEDFREKYPDVADRLGLDSEGGGFSFRWGPEEGASPFQGPWSSPRLGLPRQGFFAPPEDDGGERLGVYVQPAPSGVVSYLGYEEGVGLVVQQVEEGSFADTLGLERGDLILRMNGEEIRGVQAVRKALESVATGEGVEVEIARRGHGPMNLSGTKPAPPPLKALEGTRRT